METKQVMVMRRDLNMSPGKLAAQTAHASLLAYEVATDDYRKAWRRSGVTKVVLQEHSESAIIRIYKAAIAAYLPTALICDEGRTEVPSGTITGVGIGPAEKGAIDKITGALELYK